MNTKLFTGLALAAALLIGQPVFARDNHAGGRGGGGARGHAVAAVHHSSGGGARIASRSSHTGGFRSTSVASRRTAVSSATRNLASTRNTSRSRHSVAFGGSANNSFSNGNGGHANYKYAFASHSGWTPGRQYSWNGHHYRWYNNGWYIIDPFPVGWGYYGPNYGYYNGDYNSGSIGAQVQAALSRDGYYRGPVDGLVGPGTRAALAAFQRDNGLRVTGNITPRLLAYMGIG
jgi:hypothetical protein